MKHKNILSSRNHLQSLPVLKTTNDANMAIHVEEVDRFKQGKKDFKQLIMKLDTENIESLKSTILPPVLADSRRSLAESPSRKDFTIAKLRKENLNRSMDIKA